MSKVLKSDAALASDDAYVQKNLGTGYADIYISFDYYITSAARAALVSSSGGGPYMFIMGGGSHNNQLQGIYIYFNNTDLIWDVWFGYVGGQWPADGIGMAADTWHTMDTRQNKATGEITFKIDGTTYGPFSEGGGWGSGGLNMNTLIIGQFTPIFGSPVYETLYFDNIKIGTTALGSSDVFSDDFESGGITNWTSSYGNVSVLDDPFSGPVDYTDAGTIYVDATPSVDESLDDGKTVPVLVTPSRVELAQYVETPQVYADVSFSGDDCYNVATPDFEVEDFKKWELQEGIKRWGTLESGKRWNVFEVAGSFDNECR